MSMKLNFNNIKPVVIDQDGISKWTNTESRKALYQSYNAVSDPTNMGADSIKFSPQEMTNGAAISMHATDHSQQRVYSNNMLTGGITLSPQIMFSLGLVGFALFILFISKSK
jgi:hypothetical protein